MPAGTFVGAAQTTPAYVFGIQLFHDQRATLHGICRISSRYPKPACPRRGNPAYRIRTSRGVFVTTHRPGRSGGCGRSRSPTLLRRDRRTRRSNLGSCIRFPVWDCDAFAVGSKRWSVHPRMGIPARRSSLRRQQAEVHGEYGLSVDRTALFLSGIFRLVNPTEARHLIAFDKTAW